MTAVKMTHEELAALPPHQLLRLAVWDMAMVQAGQRTADKDRPIDMEMRCWLVVGENTCSVCMAGAVLLQQHDWKPDTVSVALNKFEMGNNTVEYHPDDEHSSAAFDWMDKIDRMRVGFVPENVPDQHEIEDRWRVRFANAPSPAPLEMYLRFADDIEKAWSRATYEIVTSDRPNNVLASYSSFEDAHAAAIDMSEGDPGGRYMVYDGPALMAEFEGGKEQ